MGPLGVWPTVATATAFILLAGLERLWPLRPRTEAAVPRLLRNLALGGVSAAVVVALQALMLRPLGAWLEARHLGLLPLLRLPRALEVAAGVLLLDYTLWHWHRWNHRLGFLWRFHLVHHADRDLDASTGLRFHFGEMALSVVYRAGQIALVGADVLMIDLWTALLFVSILFHHSNLRLPPALERSLVRLLVTPRMHGIHHSERHEEMDTNFSSLLSVWDVLHRTLRLDVPQARVTIGVPGYRDAPALGLLTQLRTPFRLRPGSCHGAATAPRV
jgi:sterol desaturase/sphingolipid hydroxylase (fatty acid hydroxylase superfamily)